MDRQTTWLATYHRFMAENGNRIDRLSMFDHEPLDLYRLYHAVTAHGGLAIVTNKKLWRQVTRDLGVGPDRTDAGFRLRTHYAKYLYEFEKAFFNKEQTAPEFARTSSVLANRQYSTNAASISSSLSPLAIRMKTMSNVGDRRQQQQIKENVEQYLPISSTNQTTTKINNNVTNIVSTKSSSSSSSSSSLSVQLVRQLSPTMLRKRSADDDPTCSAIDHQKDTDERDRKRIKLQNNSIALRSVGTITPTATTATTSQMTASPQQDCLSHGTMTLRQYLATSNGAGALQTALSAVVAFEATEITTSVEQSIIDDFVERLRFESANH